MPAFDGNGFTAPSAYYPYIYKIPMEYLHRDTKFLAVPSVGPALIVATTIMDGHAVSPSFGRSQGNEYYLNRERNYINLTIDAFPHDRYGTSRSINEKDGWLVFVAVENYGVYLKDLYDEHTKEEVKVSSKKQQVQDQIKKAEELLSDAQKKLTDLE